MTSAATLTFLGAAQTVTGSKYLVETDDHRVLVDSGLFQGLKALRERNWAPLPVDAASIDAIVLTHAHLDHSGYLPRLVSEGFRGRVFCTPGTMDLCRLVLPDAGRIQEEDARQANRHGYSKHKPALPLFSEADAWRAVSQLQPVGYSRPVPVASGIEVEFIPAGHLLGSAYVRMRFGGPDGRDILFGGDLGRFDRPVLKDPSMVASADVLLLESTYGGRNHPVDDDDEELEDIIKRTLARGGKVVIPSFAIGRVEEILYRIQALESADRIPALPVYVDSPMAIEALKYYTARVNELDPEMREGERRVCAFCTERFQTVPSPRQSKALVRSSTPAIIISSSGMATGGRVLHHLEAVLPDPRHSIVFVGYQAIGTRGRRLTRGEREVKMHGRMVPVEAEIHRLDSMSAHADQSEILRWVGAFERAPDMTYLVHGENDSMTTLKAALEERLSWPVEIPEYLDTVPLDI